MPSSLSSMSFKNSSFDFALISASLKSGSIIMVASFDKICKCSSLPPSGAAIMKKSRAGFPSIDWKSIPSGTVIAERPAALTPADFACGVAMPSPSPVVPDASRASTSFLYCALSFKLPPFSMRSASWSIAPDLSPGFAPRRMLSCLRSSVTLILHTPLR